MSDLGTGGVERLDRGYAANGKEQLVDVAEMEAALDALLGKHDLAEPAGWVNWIALQRAFRGLSPRHAGPDF